MATAANMGQFELRRVASMHKRLIITLTGWLIAAPLAAQDQPAPPPVPTAPAPAPAAPAPAPQPPAASASSEKNAKAAKAEAPLPAVPLPPRKGDAKAPSPVLSAKRVPLEQWRPEQCPKPSKPGEIVVCGRPDEMPPPPPAEPVEPGSRDDVVSEREALAAPVRTGDGSCSAVGPNGGMGCGAQMARQWKRDKAAAKAAKAAEDRKIDEKKTP